MKKLLSILVLFSMLISSCAHVTDQTVSSPRTSMQLVADMGVGWNLGNTLDAKGDDETAWGNPRATKSLIDAIRARGFKTLRVPVTWQYHMGVAPDYLIDPSWLDRVEEVIGYGLANDMVVILNVHHDEEWLIPTYQALPKSKQILASVWRQVATRFRDYDEQLIFETMNEPRLKESKEEWLGGSEEGRDSVNQLHAVAAKAIRATGGNNSWRHLMVSTYAASALPEALAGLILPDTDNVIVSVHNYFPYEFTLSRTESRWGSEADKNALDASLDAIVDQFVAQGVPVVMGEWGSQHNHNLEDRIRHAEYYSRACQLRGIPTLWWDNGIADEFAIIDRVSHQWLYPELVDALFSEKP